MRSFIILVNLFVFCVPVKADTKFDDILFYTALGLGIISLFSEDEKKIDIPTKPIYNKPKVIKPKIYPKDNSERYIRRPNPVIRPYGG